MRPAAILSKVDLPHPEGPDDGKEFRWRGFKRDVVECDEVCVASLPSKILVTWSNPSLSLTSRLPFESLAAMPGIPARTTGLFAY